ncbi:uncharacterized protein LOC109841382 [Asparagus officinalis]|uniref:uncharacterized protein LOC109841382 n=1 Tax=Asparagus officinalis TaxID=4686 RepID=UPI00098E4A5B|nr:uncharacterized protein LOC109841382 [Asparagus officinalis]
MVISDQEISRCLESLLRHSALGSVTSVNGVVSHLESELGLDLSHKTSFIRDQIQLFLLRPPPKDHFALSPSPHLHQYRPFPLGSARHGGFGYLNHELGFRHPARRAQVSGGGASACSSSSSRAAAAASFQAVTFADSGSADGDSYGVQDRSQVFADNDDMQKKLEDEFRVYPTKEEAFNILLGVIFTQIMSVKILPVRDLLCFHSSFLLSDYGLIIAPTGVKRRGGPGGLSKVCSVSPELQAIVGEPTMARTEIVKQLWAYIRRNNLQDPNNKRKIICNDELRLVFETDCTDMFKMNKLLTKHIITLQPTRNSVPDSKRLKSSAEPEAVSSTSADVKEYPVFISDALAEFFGTGEREMLEPEALRRILEYITANNLEVGMDPENKMSVSCDSKLQQLFGSEKVPALGIPEMLARHLFKQS